MVDVLGKGGGVGGGGVGWVRLWSIFGCPHADALAKTLFVNVSVRDDTQTSSLSVGSIRLLLQPLGKKVALFAPPVGVAGLEDPRR